MNDTGRVFHGVLRALIMLALAGFARADDAAANAILARLQAARGDLEYTQPKPSAIAGLYEVGIVGGPTLYVTADGSMCCT